MIMFQIYLILLRRTLKDFFPNGFTTGGAPEALGKRIFAILQIPDFDYQNKDFDVLLSLLAKIWPLKNHNFSTGVISQQLPEAAAVTFTGKAWVAWIIMNSF